ncbi:MAG TPA: hypothetical protein VJ949_13890 [Cryomorphaceae bacterium]|nr:hypothetical protein [Cryomorphaceae bacterium]
MTENSISTLALVLCLAPGILHSAEVAYPLLVRWLANYVLPFFEPGLPKGSNKNLTGNEQMAMLEAALSAAPKEKKTAAEDYIFVLLFEQRQGALAFLSVIAGAVYGMQLPLEDRAVLHLLLLVMSVLFMLVNANHAGISFLGHHPKISRNGRNVGIVFSFFWLASSVLNYLAFTYASV